MRDENKEETGLTVPMGDSMDESHERKPIASTPPPTGLLPGVACISIYLLVLAMVNAFFAARGKFGIGPAKYGVLAVSTLIAVGVFGTLRMRRWGWALITAGCLVVSTAYFYSFHLNHVPPYILQGFFMLLFFLYLARPEVRERLR